LVLQAIARSFYQKRDMAHSLLYAATLLAKGFSATAVGIAMGSGSLAGVLGRFFLGGLFGGLSHPMGAS